MAGVPAHDVRRSLALGARPRPSGVLAQSVRASGSMCVWTCRTSGTAARIGCSSRSTVACASPSGRLARQLDVQRELVAAVEVHHAHVVDLAHAGHVQRRRRRALAQVALRLGGLDVDDDVGAGQLGAHRVLDGVGDACAWTSPASGASADDEVDEVRAGRVAHAHAAGLDGTSSCAIARRIASAASTSALSISTSIEAEASRPAAIMTSTATTSAAIASAFGSPAATRIRPTSTASEPARSEKKCSALEASAGEWNAREARRLSVARERSMAITTASTANDHHVASTWWGVLDGQPRDALIGQEHRDEDQERALGQRREVLGLAVAVVVLLVGRADAPRGWRTRSAARRRRRCPSARPRRSGPASR